MGDLAFQIIRELPGRSRYKETCDLSVDVSLPPFYEAIEYAPQNARPFRSCIVIGRHPARDRAGIPGVLYVAHDHLSVLNRCIGDGA